MYLNSVHITFDLPQEQANYLNKYASENYEKLKSLGILAVHLNDNIKFVQNNQISTTTTSVTTTAATTTTTTNEIQELNNINKNNLIQPKSKRNISTTNRSRPSKIQDLDLINHHHNQIVKHQQYKMPSPLLKNLLNKEIQLSNIDINKNIQHMSDDYKQIYNLREILVKKQELNTIKQESLEIQISTSPVHSNSINSKNNGLQPSIHNDLNLTYNKLTNSLVDSSLKYLRTNGDEH